MHTSRYQDCDLSLSSHSPTANQGGAECHHCGHPQQNRCPMVPPPTLALALAPYPSPQMLPTKDLRVMSST